MLLSEWQTAPAANYRKKKERGSSLVPQLKRNDPGESRSDGGAHSSEEQGRMGALFPVCGRHFPEMWALVAIRASDLRGRQKTRRSRGLELAASNCYVVGPPHQDSSSVTGTFPCTRRAPAAGATLRTDLMGPDLQAALLSRASSLQSNTDIRGDFHSSKGSLAALSAINGNGEASSPTHPLQEDAAPARCYCSRRPAKGTMLTI
ncbi:hypothetical protein VUR80DRAFT_9704 [Thermomyces stellatus]